MSLKLDPIIFLYLTALYTFAVAPCPNLALILYFSLSNPDYPLLVEHE
jgi:hypothetical protein